MEIRSFIKFLITEKNVKNEKNEISILEPPLVTDKDGTTYSNGRALHPNVSSALNHNGKMMFYAFDLTNKCNRGCPGCYVDRAKEISCNAVKDIPIKEYKGDLNKWEALAKDPKYVKSNPGYPAALEDAKRQTNANGGIRMFSAADYPNASDPEYIKYMSDAGITDKDFFKHQVDAFMHDAKVNGWHVKAITKELNFLKDHIHHDALKGVDVSMNAQGFGESHESVKAMKKGEHEKFTPEENAKLKKHTKKIIGRTVTHTPFDLLKILEHKDDHKHIGVITSAHDIPGNGIRYVPSKPKEPFSPKTIIIQVNFPDKLMHVLNGVGKASVSETTASLNEYVAKYNKIRDKVKAGLDAGHLEISAIKYQIPTEVQEAKKPLPVEDDVELDTSVAQDEPETDDQEGGDEVGAKLNPQQVVTLDRKNGVWYQTVSYRNHEKKSAKSKANLIPDIENQFDIINPKYTQTFTEQDAKFLLGKMKGKMCCAGDIRGKEAKGKCNNCNAKCGVAGCGSNVDEPKGKKQKVEESKFIDLL